MAEKELRKQEQIVRTWTYLQNLQKDEQFLEHVWRHVEAQRTYFERELRNWDSTEPQIRAAQGGLKVIELLEEIWTVAEREFKRLNIERKNGNGRKSGNGRANKVRTGSIDFG